MEEERERAREENRELEREREREREEKRVLEFRAREAELRVRELERERVELQKAQARPNVLQHRLEEVERREHEKSRASHHIRAARAVLGSDGRRVGSDRGNSRHWRVGSGEGGQTKSRCEMPAQSVGVRLPPTSVQA